METDTEEEKEKEKEKEQESGQKRKRDEGQVTEETSRPTQKKKKATGNLPGYACSLSTCSKRITARTKVYIEVILRVGAE